MRKIRPHTRYFSILEVLVCLALTSLCIIPLVKPHYVLARSRLQTIRSFQLEWLADEIFSSIRSDLYEKKIKWTDLSSGQRRPKIYNQALNTPLTIECLDRTESYNAAYSIKVLKQYRKSDRADYRLLDIAITLSSSSNTKTHHYQLFVERVKEA